MIDLKLIGATETDLIQAPATEKVAVTGMTFTNTGTTDVFLTLLSYLKNDTYGTKNIRLPNVKIMAGNVLVLDKSDLRTLSDLQKYSAKATVENVISVEICYEEV